MRSLFIVDDDEIYNKALANKLSDHFVVRYFLSGEALLTYLESHPAPDILTIDLDMPGMTGKELYLSLRDQAAYKHTKLIVLSANESGQVVLDLINNGVRDYVIKDDHVVENLIQAIAGEGDLY